MAFLRDLVGVLADLDGRGFSTVDYVARELRRQGLVTPSVRGRAAAPLSVEDAAVVLIGLNCGETLARAPEATEALWALPPRFLPEPSSLHPHFRPLVEARSFGEAIVSLVVMAAEFGALERKGPGPVPQNDRRAHLLDGLDNRRWVSVVVDFAGLERWTRIRVQSHFDAHEIWTAAPARFDIHYRRPPALHRHGPALANRAPDRLARSSITLTTFEAVHACLFQRD